MAEELDELRKECDKLDKKLLPYYSAETIRSLNLSKWEVEQAKRAQAQIQRKHEAITSKLLFGPELDAIFEKYGLAPLSACVALFASIALFFGSVYTGTRATILTWGAIVLCSLVAVLHALWIYISIQHKRHNKKMLRVYQESLRIKETKLARFEFWSAAEKHGIVYRSSEEIAMAEENSTTLEGTGNGG